MKEKFSNTNGYTILDKNNSKMECMNNFINNNF